MVGLKLICKRKHTHKKRRKSDTDWLWQNDGSEMAEKVSEMEGDGGCETGKRRGNGGRNGCSDDWLWMSDKATRNSEKDESISANDYIIP